MAQRVIVQTQKEYTGMNLLFIKWVIILGGVIFGYLILSGDYDLPKVIGIVAFVPLLIWVVLKLIKRS